MSRTVPTPDVGNPMDPAVSVQRQRVRHLHVDRHAIRTHTPGRPKVRTLATCHARYTKSKTTASKTSNTDPGDPRSRRTSVSTLTGLPFALPASRRTTGPGLVVPWRLQPGGRTARRRQRIGPGHMRIRRSGVGSRRRQYPTTQQLCQRFGARCSRNGWNLHTSASRVENHPAWFMVAV